MKINKEITYLHNILINFNVQEIWGKCFFD